jgi:hypothetical protein
MVNAGEAAAPTRDSRVPSARRSGLRGRTSSLVAVASYSVIGAALLWSRFASIDQSLWHDEIYTVQHFVVHGPSGSFGRYNTNDHILFSVLAWLTVRLPGLSDSAYRLWSIVPFVAAVVLVTAWLHVRAGSFVAIVFALLCTTSTQLLILSTEARGYGLAFLAMAVMTVTALEALRGMSSAALNGFTTAGVLGCWTLPTFALPFTGLIAILISERALRRRLITRLGFALVALAAWYAAPASALINSRAQRFGAPLPWHAPLTGAGTELASAFVPSLDATALLPMLVVIPTLALGLVVSRAAIPEVTTITAVPVAFTFLVLTLTRFYVEERFVSYLLVPIFILTAFGLKGLVIDTRPPGWVGTVTYATGLTAVALFAFIVISTRDARMPEEANREAAGAVTSALLREARPVIVNTRYPDDLLYYAKEVHPLRVAARGLERRICSPAMRKTGLIYVEQPYGIRPVNTSCLVRQGASVQMWRQWDRGGRISVWVLPPASHAQAAERRAYDLTSRSFDPTASPRRAASPAASSIATFAPR